MLYFCRTKTAVCGLYWCEGSYLGGVWSETVEKLKLLKKDFRNPLYSGLGREIRVV
jgi:hypothetical protein